MTLRGRRGIFLGGIMAVGLALALIVPFVAQGADQFASPAFQQQWNSVESVVPNFWGPLATALNGQTEQYAEGVLNGQSGIRLVQYFDKARMEQTNPSRPVTNGLLTVELKSGQLQLGDASFQPLNPSLVGIAGDPDVPGPKYASLAQLPEKSPQQTGAVNLGYDTPSGKFVTITPFSDPQTAFVTYQADPGGRYGQNIPKAFWDFMQNLPGPGWLTTMGYPISPAFATNVRVGGHDNTPVFVQAFERRVLTYTPSNPAAFRVEFGNIGQHYYKWRYQQSSTTTNVTPNPLPVTATPSPTTPATASATVDPGRGTPPTVPAGTTIVSPAPNPLPSTRP